MNFMNDKNQMDRDLLIERLINQESVSYTHLTLPTIHLV